MQNSILIFDEKERVGQWVADQVEQTSSWGDYYAMGIACGKEIVSGIVFNNWNGSNATAHIAITRATKLLPDLLRHAFYYAFRQHKLNRLTGMVEAGNKKAAKFNKHLGFEHEFTMKKAGNNGDDLHLLVMWPEKCRWI
jgi:RimJ/RimL family protein N-acetyltransferase